jgi:hypothetical protein
MTDYNKDYALLVTRWAIEKKAEQQANSKRLEIESKILAIVNSELKESGTNNFPNNLKILTGFTATCDGQAVNNLYQKYINNELNIGTFDFPFKHKWEPHIKTLDEIHAFDASIYNKYFADVVTIKPKKPTFEVKKDK